MAGAQLLLRRMPVLGWHLAYVPRGPIGDLDDPAVRDALVAALRSLGAAEKIATVRADPGGAPRDAVRPRAAGGAVARGAKGPAADDARHRPRPSARKRCAPTSSASIGST